VVSALVLLLAQLVAPGEAPKPAASPSTAQGAAAAISSKTIVGEIVWVDFPSRLVLVRESVKSAAVPGKSAPGKSTARESVAMAVAPDVPVIRGKKPSTFAELKPKDHVVARYLPAAGGARAVSLRVAEATPPAPPARAMNAGDGSNAN
jgi:hypothetical protein